MRPSERLDQNRDAIREIAHRHGVRDVRVFGSVARRQDHDGSDIDLLVQGTDETSLFDLARIRIEASDLTGCPVEVHTLDGMSAPIREAILKDAVPL